MTHFSGKARAPQPLVRCGFTLVETIAAIVVVGILGSMASFTIFGSVSIYADATTRARLHAEASVGLARLVVELQAIEIDPESSQTAPWISDARRDRLRWSDAKSIEFQSGQVLLNGDLLVGDVIELSMDYFDHENDSLMPGNQVPPAQVIDIRRISISMTLSRYGQMETVHSKAFIRSMRAEVGL